MNIHIEHGLVEGPAHSKKLRMALESAGHTITAAKSADLLICHSGGIYTVPELETKPPLIAFGPPILHRKPLPLASAQLALLVTRSWRALQLLILSTFIYSITGLHRWLYMFMRSRRYSIQKVLSRHNIAAIVMTDNDHFMHKTKTRQLAKTANWRVIETSGGHDDLWHNPSKYLELINSLAN